MSAFKRRELPADTLGESLKMVREEDGLTIAELGRRANVQPKYVAALEAGRYEQTPGPTYVRGFLRSLADVLNLSPDAVVARFDAEPFPAVPGMPGHQKSAFTLSYRAVRTIGLSAIVLAAMVYFGLQIVHIVAPPPITLTQPVTDVVVTEPQVTLEGATKPEVDVQVNGRAIQVDDQGHFKETVDLQPGINTLVVTARKKRSRAATLTRRVLVELPAVVQ